MLGGDGWDAPQLWELGGAALNGDYISNHYSVDDPSPAIQKFVADYKARYNMLPDALAALGYDAMKVLADAIKRAGGTEGREVARCYCANQRFPGRHRHRSRIDTDRNAVKPAVVLETSGSKVCLRDDNLSGRHDTASRSAQHQLTSAAALRSRLHQRHQQRHRRKQQVTSSMDTFVQQLINGLTIGAIYALIALGYTMVYGILRLINFAHGDIYMVGAFVGYFIARYSSVSLLDHRLLGSVVVLVGSMIIAALVGMAIERFAYRPVRKYSRMTTLITAIGVSLLIENLFVAQLGAAPRAFPILGSQSQSLPTLW